MTHDNPATEKQRKAIRAMSAKAGVGVPENLDMFTRGQASEYITRLEETLDGPSVGGREPRSTGDGGNVAHRARIGLATKLVYSRLARSGKDPLELETFQDDVLAVYDVLLELEEAR